MCCTRCVPTSTNTWPNVEQADAFPGRQPAGVRRRRSRTRWPRCIFPTAAFRKASPTRRMGRCARDSSPMPTSPKWWATIRTRPGCCSRAARWAADRASARDYLDAMGRCWTLEVSRRALVRWLFNHPAVLAERDAACRLLRKRQAASGQRTIKKARLRRALPPASCFPP